MKTRAAVLRKAGTPWEITELELDPPQANEVLIQMEAAGLCHSDEHIRAHGHGAAAAGRRARGSRRRGRDRPRRHPGEGGRPGLLLLHPGLRQVPLLLHRQAEPVRRRPVRGRRLPAGQDLPVPPERRGLRRHVRGRQLRRVLGAVRVVLREDRGLRADGARGAGELRRDDRVLLRGLRGRRPRRRRRGGLRHRRRRHERRAGRRATPARSTSSPSTPTRGSSSRRSTSAPPTRSATRPRPRKCSSTSPAASSPTR